MATIDPIARLSTIWAKIDGQFIHQAVIEATSAKWRFVPPCRPYVLAMLQISDCIGQMSAMSPECTLFIGLFRSRKFQFPHYSQVLLGIIT